MRHLFIRNIRVGELFERFLVAAVTSLLAVRFYLYLTGYPQVGGGNLHIAHMLWGGALMLLAFILSFAFLGFRIQRAAAVIGGAGFGIFIDEVGKFVTKDNNYFYRPAIGIIYAIFVGIYVLASFLGRRQRLTSHEYQLNALAQYEEAILNDFDSVERAKATQLLSLADSHDRTTRQLRRLVDESDIVAADTPSWRERFVGWLRSVYDQAWSKRHSGGLVKAFFAVQISLFMIAVLVGVYDNIDDVRRFFMGDGDYGQGLVIGQLISTVVAGGLAVVGAVRLSRSRRQALEYFRLATLTNLLLTQFFLFSRIQFGALIGFAFNLALLVILNFSLEQETRQIPQVNRKLKA